MFSRARVLVVDKSWTPEKWVGWDEALSLQIRGLVDYPIGENVVTLRGGFNAVTGKQSVLELSTILVVDTKGHKTPFDWVPAVSKELLFGRDRYTCAYCGHTFKEKDLTMEHITPKSKGGKDSWMNLVAACRSCNGRKEDRTPEEARMPLLYVPYVPNRFEKMIVENRSILADQMEFLLSKVPKHSRFIQ